MKKIARDLRDYFVTINKALLFFTTLFVALAIFINYRFGLNKMMGRLSGPLEFFAWYGLFLFAFSYVYLLQAAIVKATHFQHKKFIALLLIAPAFFAWKMAAKTGFHFSADLFKNAYWNDVVYWPLKLVILVGMIYLAHRYFDREKPFYGATSKGFKPRPYVTMLVLMLPLILAASTQKDFQAMYPRLQGIHYLAQPGRGWAVLLYEISYGSDFFSIELFFRGFLVLAFARWAGRGAILPMAVFYCTIHFGKPLGECVSSYFGGIILGVVAYNTQSVVGGFLVHVGIAWLMELGGYAGHRFF